MTSTIHITPEYLDGIVLQSGGHAPGSGEYCFNEYVALKAGEKHSDNPSTESPILCAYTTRLNDRWNDEDRQLLKPYADRVIGTAGDGQDEARMAIAQAALTMDLLPPWLRLAGLDDHADIIAGLKDADRPTIIEALRNARQASWTKRSESRTQLEVKIREALKNRAVAAAGASAAAVAAEAAAAAAAAAVAVEAAAEAAAAAGAVAVAVGAVAVAEAAAAAAEAAAAAAAAGAVAVEAVAVEAVAVEAVAAAAAAAAAVAAAEAEAAAGVVAGSIDWWGKPYTAAYNAAKKWFQDNPSPELEKVRALAAEQRDAGLILLDKMIDPSKALVIGSTFSSDFLDAVREYWPIRWFSSRIGPAMSPERCERRSHQGVYEPSMEELEHLQGSLVAQESLRNRLAAEQAKVSEVERLARAWVRNGVTPSGQIRMSELANSGRILLGQLGLDVPPLTDAERNRYRVALDTALPGEGAAERDCPTCDPHASGEHETGCPRRGKSTADQPQAEEKR